ncbi:MAG TPA: rhomboid family intramembrane serine protease [Polyangiaceae bacterium]
MSQPTQSPEPPRPIFTGDVRPARASQPADEWKAWATYALIAANVAMFVFELVSGAGVQSPTAEQMLALGADFGPLTCNGQPWRLVTAMFMHFGVIHIGMNMVCLYQVRIVERMMSRAEFVALYLASGLVGGLASLAFHPLAVSAGASGAVFGMFGAFTAIMVVRRNRIDPRAWKRTMQSLSLFFGINLVFGLSQREIDMSAHVGGLVAGFVGAYVLAKTARPTSKRLLRALVVLGVGAAIAFGGIQVLPR